MAELSWTAHRGACAIEVALGDDGLRIAVSRGRLQFGSATPMRLCTSDGTDLLANLRPLASEERVVTEAYDLAVGKRVGRHEVTHVERSVTLVRPDGSQVTLLLRAADDGVAFRVVLHGVDGVTVSGSDVDVAFPADAPLWPLAYTPWYEEPRFAATLGTLDAGDYGLPLLVQVVPDDDESFVLVAESDVDGRYGGSYLAHDSGTFSMTLADPVRFNSVDVAVPWRVFHLGNLATIVESHLVEDLAPPAAEPIPPWVRPGRAAWSWWSDFYSGAQLQAQLRLVDYAADHGWEYVLVDCGWDRTWMPELVAAASARGVGIFVWISWDWLDIHATLAEWATWGVAGIKVDFMESEAQERYRWYDDVIAEAGRVGLMVNFHGSVIPRGWARTHPHVVTYEAVRGAEYYAFYSEPLPPEHNTIIPFTRNVVGSADYTPVTFSTTVRATSDAHELALAVVLESGITHYADDVSEYTSRPLAQRVLDLVQAAWDETRLLGGRPGEWVAIARRGGANWFVGLISAGSARSVEVDVGGLFPGEVQVITDGPDGQLRDSTRTPTRAPLQINLAANGGAVILPVDARPWRCSEPLPVPSPAVDLIFAHPGETITVALRDRQDTDPAAVELITQPGWPAPIQVGPRRWEVRVPDDVGPAHVAVMTLRAPDLAKKTAVAHVRVVSYPAAGTTDLVHCSPIAVSNGFGPVERDTSNGPGNPHDGAPITVSGTTYPSGYGVSSPSTLTFAVGGHSARFTCLVGIDDETPGTVATVEVTGDGVTLARAELHAGEPARPLEVNISGRIRLGLVVRSATDSDPSTQPHVDWIEPQLHSPLYERTAR